MMKTLYFTATALFGAALFSFWGATVGIASAPAPGGPVEAAGPAGKRFTLADVAAHSKPGDCWMAIGGAVYDVSAYVPRHPAPPAVIAEWCGKEATRAYATKNRARSHSARASGLLSQFEVGVLEAATPD
jgi:Cytochrome b5-like Heme/Steroid binding domain